ncbi:MAG: hypothetical protein PHU70_02045 [Dehalococcoidia bacterium]|nr:hypothetical protein [Dehalococcoidia bacterium]
MTTSVANKGTGRPDFSLEVAGAKSRAGVHLTATQQLCDFAVVFTDAVAHPYLIPWVQDRLAATTMAHIYDVDTGVATPFTVPAGYNLIMIMKDWNTDQRCELLLYFDTLLVAGEGMSEAWENWYWNGVTTYDIAMLDPDFTTAHTVDLQITNLAANPLSGAFHFSAILEAMNTPPFPVVKTTGCPYCGHTQEEPVSTANVICRKCSKPYVVMARRKKNA